MVNFKIFKEFIKMLIICEAMVKELKILKIKLKK